MEAHTKRMERFKKSIFKQREEISDRMAKMFELLRELTSSRTPKKVLVREETGNPITKNINAISLIKMEKKKGVKGGKVAKGNMMKLNELEALEPIELEARIKPFILGTPFLTTAKAVIIFEKGTITLKSSKNKIDFVKVPALPSELEKSVEDDLDPITLTNTVSRLVLKWEERSKYHQEKEMEFNQWRSMVFNKKGFIFKKEGCEERNEGGVT
nr:hypothetical protein [Tanacetum cinerariifolium]